MTEFGRWLDARKMSIEKFAADAGIGFTTVRAWAIEGAKPRPMARRLIAMKFPDCPLAAAKITNPVLLLNRNVVRKFRGFPDEDQNEGHVEHGVMSARARIELAGFILRQYVLGILSLPEFPPMDRTAVRIIRRGEDVD